MAGLTPMMKQYFDIKEKYLDCILFFRLGDFYEMFFDDAILASRELEITLTGRDCGQEERAPMCGVPFHSADSYIARLVDKGYKVAICEQVEDPSTAVGIVKRDVVRIITPGTITDSKVLDEKSNNYLCCIYLSEGSYGISYVDISTGHLYTTELSGDMNFLEDSLIDELAKIKPTELICNKYIFDNKSLIGNIKNRFNTIINSYKEWIFNSSVSEEIIKRQLSILTLDGIGLSEKYFSISSTGALIEYLNETQKVALSHLNNVTYYSVSSYMILDINTRRNLEISETIRGKNRKGSLIWLLDKTSTAMGGRLLKKWVEEPLISKNDIEYRLNLIDILVNDIMLMDSIKELLREVYDIERLLGKISYGNCNARDMIALKNSIVVLPDIKNLLINSHYDKLNELASSIDTLEDIFELINDSIIEDPPLTIKEGRIIKGDYNKELWQYRESTQKGRKWIASLEEDERIKTGIKSLKVGYNKIFGYYIEVTKSNLSMVPDHYMRKQTLANSERYITPELKEMEAKILGAEEKMVALEYEIFIDIRNKISHEIKRIQETSKVISTIDVINALAQVAYKNNYVKPILNTEGIIEIKNGRHPVIEKMIDGELFVPNDTLLNNEEDRISIITGPNMAGKSTYMRQVALITLLAQVGSFVPAESANIGIVDRIFTRIGASDDLTQGQSTFMVEMSEVANIINNGTSNSLIILDEIGRGTSTFDGLSIAWAVVEYISDRNRLGAKTLFATHYHELTELEGKINGVKNYKILVREKEDEIIFLRKIIRGGADRSYGIEVAKLAGVSKDVIRRANEILFKLEERDINKSSIAITTEYTNSKTNNNHNIEKQLSIFQNEERQLIEKLKKIDVLNITPVDALNILNKLVEESKRI